MHIDQVHAEDSEQITSGWKVAVNILFKKFIISPLQGQHGFKENPEIWCDEGRYLRAVPD